MKRLKFEKKLNLKKGVIAKLDNSKMNNLQGGYLVASRYNNNCSNTGQC